MSVTTAPEIVLERRASNGKLSRISIGELFGKSYVLLAGSDGYAWTAAAEALRGRLAGVSLDIHRVGTKELRDPDGRFAVEYGVGLDGAVLVKPDRTLAWRARGTSANPETELAEAFSSVVGMRPASFQDGRGMVRSTQPGVALVQPAPALARKVSPAPEPIARKTSKAPRVVQISPGGFHNPFAMPVPSLEGIKLYVHPVSMFSRPIRLFVAESGLKVNEVIVDLVKGEHRGEAYTKKNPSQMVPMLEEGDFRLTESSAILKYLADRANSPAYPSDPVRRAKIDEMMDWFNTQFYRDWGHNLCLPQLFPHHQRRSEEAHAGALEWGRENSRRWLQVLNDHWIGNDDYLVGNRLTLADYFGSALVTLGEVVQTDFSKYPNVERWLSNMKGLKHWTPVNEAFNDVVAANTGRAFETV